MTKKLVIQMHGYQPEKPNHLLTSPTISTNDSVSDKSGDSELHPTALRGHARTSPDERKDGWLPWRTVAAVCVYAHKVMSCLRRTHSRAANETQRMDVVNLLSDIEHYEAKDSRIFFFLPQTPSAVDSRRVFSSEQQRLLQVEYEQGAYPSKRKMKYIAQRLDSTPRRVQIWFQNKRQREEEASDDSWWQPIALEQ
ncbi:hypothetical protein PROFUN_13715 [Planoprotostelium fungivorum]|uniref:Homeobox domain-containing protein n=1 Tax=Planoprotostelium fungivorum TaxID=1890364 RepID=A0A2P6N387_9EUKA|nr:hypothetical protein PROFUN_13715 [Planoprotostelium fungivorum]